MCLHHVNNYKRRIKHFQLQAVSIRDMPLVRPAEHGQKQVHLQTCLTHTALKGISVQKNTGSDTLIAGISTAARYTCFR